MAAARSRRSPPATPSARLRRQAATLRARLAALRADRAAALRAASADCKRVAKGVRKAGQQLRATVAGVVAKQKAETATLVRLLCAGRGATAADRQTAEGEAYLLEHAPALVPLWRQLAPDIEAGGSTATALAVFVSYVEERPADVVEALEASGASVADQADERAAEVEQARADVEETKAWIAEKETEASQTRSKKKRAALKANAEIVGRRLAPAERYLAAVTASDEPSADPVEPAAPAAPGSWEAFRDRDKTLRRLQADSDRATDRRAALPPGSSRARVTTANAKWAIKAEARDRRLAELRERWETPLRAPSAVVARTPVPGPPAQVYPDAWSTGYLSKVHGRIVRSQGRLSIAQAVKAEAQQTNASERDLAMIRLYVGRGNMARKGAGALEVLTALLRNGTPMAAPEPPPPPAPVAPAAPEPYNPRVMRSEPPPPPEPPQAPRTAEQIRARAEASIPVLEQRVREVFALRQNAPDARGRMLADMALVDAKESLALARESLAGPRPSVPTLEPSFSRDAWIATVLGESQEWAGETGALTEKTSNMLAEAASDVFAAMSNGMRSAIAYDPRSIEAAGVLCGWLNRQQSMASRDRFFWTNSRYGVARRRSLARGEWWAVGDNRLIVALTLGMAGAQLSDDDDAAEAVRVLDAAVPLAWGMATDATMTRIQEAGAERDGGENPLLFLIDRARQEQDATEAPTEAPKEAPPVADGLEIVPGETRSGRVARWEYPPETFHREVDLKIGFDAYGQRVPGLIKVVGPGDVGPVWVDTSAHPQDITNGARSASLYATKPQIAYLKAQTSSAGRTRAFAQMICGRRNDYDQGAPHYNGRYVYVVRGVTIQRLGAFAIDEQWVMVEQTDVEIVAQPCGLIIGKVNDRSQGRVVVELLAETVRLKWEITPLVIRKALEKASGMQGASFAAMVSKITQVRVVATEDERDSGPIGADERTENPSRTSRKATPAATGSTAARALRETIQQVAGGSLSAGAMVDRCQAGRAMLRAFTSDRTALVRRLVDVRRADLAEAQMRACDTSKGAVRAKYDGEIAKLQVELAGLERQIATATGKERVEARGKLPALPRDDQDALIEGLLMGLEPGLVPLWRRMASMVEGADADARLGAFLAFAADAESGAGEVLAAEGPALAAQLEQLGEAPVMPGAVESEVAWNGAPEPLDPMPPDAASVARTLATLPQRTTESAGTIEWNDLHEPPGSPPIDRKAPIGRLTPVARARVGGARPRSASPEDDAMNARMQRENSPPVATMAERETAPGLRPVFSTVAPRISFEAFTKGDTTLSGLRRRVTNASNRQALLDSKAHPATRRAAAGKLMRAQGELARYEAAERVRYEREHPAPPPAPRPDPLPLTKELALLQDERLQKLRAAVVKAQERVDRLRPDGPRDALYVLSHDALRDAQSNLGNYQSGMVREFESSRGAAEARAADIPRYLVETPATTEEKGAWFQFTVSQGSDISRDNDRDRWVAMVRLGKRSAWFSVQVPWKARSLMGAAVAGLQSRLPAEALAKLSAAAEKALDDASLRTGITLENALMDPSFAAYVVEAMNDFAGRNSLGDRWVLSLLQGSTSRVDPFLALYQGQKVFGYGRSDGRRSVATLSQGLPLLDMAPDPDPLAVLGPEVDRLLRDVPLAWKTQQEAEQEMQLHTSRGNPSIASLVDDAQKQINREQRQRDSEKKAADRAEKDAEDAANPTALVMWIGSDGKERRAKVNAKVNPEAIANAAALLTATMTPPQRRYLEAQNSGGERTRGAGSLVVGLLNQAIERDRGPSAAGMWWRLTGDGPTLISVRRKKGLWAYTNEMHGSDGIVALTNGLSVHSPKKVADGNQALNVMSAMLPLVWGETPADLLARLDDMRGSAPRGEGRFDTLRRLFAERTAAAADGRTENPSATLFDQPEPDQATLF